MHKIVLIALIAALAINCVYGQAAIMLVKLGEKTVIEFGPTNEVLIIVGNTDERRAIIKDGKLTSFGQEKFGDRATFHDGNLTISDLQQSDLTSYFYMLNGNAMEISLQQAS